MSAKEVNYAVYHHKGGRWTRVKTFSSEQQSDARKAAEAGASAQGVSGVTLVKETYNPVSKSTDEVSVWSSAKPGIGALGVRKAPTIAPVAVAARGGDDDGPRGGGGGGGGRSSRDDDDDVEPVLVQRNQMQPAGSPFLVVFKIVAAVTLSVAIAGVVSWLLGQINGYTLFIMMMGERNILTKVFGLFFVMSLLVTLPNFVTWKEFGAAFAVSGPKRPQQRRRTSQASQRGRTGGADRGGARGGSRGGSAERNGASGANGGSGNGGGNDDNGQPDAPPAPEPAPALEPAVEEGKKVVMTFFARCLDFLVKTGSTFMKGGKFSAYNHFGCDLFLAGAAEAYAEKKGVTDKKLDVMASVVAAAGRPWDRAKQFADKHESYLLEPHYLDMYRSGRDAMQIFLKDEDLRAQAAAGTLSKEDESMLASEGESDIGIFLEHALDAWNDKKKQPASSGTVTIMFTELIGSAQLAATQGNDAIRRMVGFHDKIVREAISRYGGREIKHANDGIMAAFNQATSAVEAGIEMMRGAELHTMSVADAPLHLKIGINAGEPIAENNDLFGTPVQLAARVCAAASSDQLVVSKIVRDLCQGKGLNFKDRGAAEMKGFAEPVPIFEVVWKDEAIPQ